VIVLWTASRSTLDRPGGREWLEAARARIRWVFDCRDRGVFKHVIVSVSGGKDSTVLAELALEEARRRGARVGLYFLDEEVVYQSTVDQVHHLMTRYPENTVPLWLQVPFSLTNATSLTEGQLVAWEPGKHELWMRHDFAAFLAHIGPKPSRSHSIDRIENERGYEPGNVRWATRREQMRNTRHNVPITHAGLTLCAAEWSLRTGVPATTIIARIRRGVPVARALDPSRMRTGPLPRVVAA